jgi:uncharacterized protein (TIGR01244 family)
MKRLHLFVALALVSACGDRTVAVPDLVPFVVPGFAHGARSGDVVLGGQPTPGVLRAFADSGYATIVSTRTGEELDWDERAVVESLGMRFVRIPIPLPVTPITAAQVAALDSVLAAPGGPVLLHCAGGTRAAVLWAVWRSQTYGVDAAVTLHQAEQAGMKLVQPVVGQLFGAGGP